jgi:hypothetical protein
MVYTKCQENEKEFPCDVTFTKNKIVISGINNPFYLKVPLSDITTADRKENKLHIRLRDDKELIITVRAGLTYLASMILRTLEFRAKSNEILSKVRNIALLTSKTISSMNNLLLELRRGSLIDWNKVNSTINSIKDLLPYMSNLGIELSDLLDELANAAKKRFIEGLRASIKRLYQRIVTDGKKVLYTTSPIFDFSSLLDAIVLLIAADLALKTGHIFDAERAFIELRDSLKKLALSLTDEESLKPSQLANRVEESLRSGEGVEEVAIQLIDELLNRVTEYYSSLLGSAQESLLQQ